VNRHYALLAAALFCSPAFAEDPYQAEGNNAFGPYAVNPALTEGAVSGFRTLHASAETLLKSLKPVEAVATSGAHILEIQNTALSSVEVTVNDTKVGVLGPLTIGRIQDVGAGKYNVVMLHTTGYKQALSLSTTALAGTMGSGEKTPNPAIEEVPVETPTE
jgi:hypothetical protein